MRSKDTSNKQVHILQEITDQLIAMLDQVTPDDYTMPWHISDCRALAPCNPLTGSRYRGINWLRLAMTSGAAGGRTACGQYFPSARYATYRQWSEEKCQVRKGAHGTRIIYFAKQREKIDSTDPSVEARERAFLKTYTVFAAEQVEGAERFHLPTVAAPLGSSYEEAERLIGAIGADIRHGFGQAMHVTMSTGEHWIEMVDRAHFPSAEGYFAVLFHELTHWTKAAVGRDRYTTEHFDDPTHRLAFEEMVAEIGAAMLCGLTSVSNTPRKDHAVYVQHFLKALRNERGFLMRAAAQAQVAVDHLISISGWQAPGAEIEDDATIAASA